MSKLRVHISLMLAWLLLVYYSERINVATNGTPIAYGVAAVVSLAVVGLNLRRRMRFSHCLLVALAAWTLGIAVLHGVRGVTWGWPLATELCFVCITISLAWWLSTGLWECESGAAQVSALRTGGRLVSLEDGRVELERELRRAQRFQRPLSLLCLHVDPATAATNLNDLLEEIQRGAVDQYQDHQLVQWIDETLRDCDLVAQHEGHFLVLLPETTREEAEQLVDDLKRRAVRQASVELQVGIAAFPKEEVTLTGLLERAGWALRADPATPATMPSSPQAES